MQSPGVVEALEMPRPPSDSVQIAIRVPKDWLDGADEIAKLISRPGFQASRTDAFRAAIARGFDVLRSEAGGAPETEAKPPRPRTRAGAKKR